MQFHSLTSKFIALTILVSLMVVLVTLVAFRAGAGRIINDMAERFCTKEALLERNKVASIIDREVVLARKMADDVTLRKWAADENNAELGKQAFRELESYRSLFRDRSFFVALADSRHYYFSNARSGRVEVSLLDPAKADDGWFFEGLRAIRGYALNLDHNPTQGETKVWFNAVMTDAGGRRIGICGGGIGLGSFLNEIVFSGEKGLKTILIDRAGVIKAHEDRSLVEHNATTRDAAGRITIFSLMDDAPRRRLLRQTLESLESGSSEVRAFPARFGGKEYLLAVSHLPAMGWFNVVLVDVSRVLSVTQFLPMVAATFVLLLLAMAAMGILVTRLVLTPLARLSQASREIARGRYDVALPVKGRDELADLTGTFNAMAATIRDHTATLETRVRERTEELSRANLLLEDSQHKIMESIGYARMIQASILPDRELMERCLGEYLLIYRPKELVGGDFYHLREVSGLLLLAVVDCTGHGVPGAFMTMTAHAVLNHVVDTVCRDDPARILSELNRAMRGTLAHGDVDAGLDISLCVLERNERRLLFSGAGLSLTILSGGEVRELRGDRQRVGYRGSRSDYEYTTHCIELATGDRCYLTSDGLLDEPGGEKGYGFGAPRFREALARTAHLAMGDQGEALERLLDEYRGGRGQRDDVTLFGFRV